MSSNRLAAVLGAVVVSGQVSAAADVVRPHSQTRPNSASQGCSSLHRSLPSTGACTLLRSAKCITCACAVASCAAACFLCELVLTRLWPVMQYSFGVLLYEMVSGERAWAGMTHVQVCHPGDRVIEHDWNWAGKT